MIFLLKMEQGDGLVPSGLKFPVGMEEDDKGYWLFLYGCATKKNSFDITLRFFFSLCENGGAIVTLNKLSHKLNTNYTSLLNAAKRLEKEGVVEISQTGGLRIIKLSRKFCEKFNEFIHYVEENDVDVSFKEEMFKDW